MTSGIHRKVSVRPRLDEQADVRVLDMAAAFLAEGLQSGEPALVIAPPPQLAAIAERLRAAAVDVEARIASGAMSCVDAEAMLAAVMLGGRPDAERFTRAAGTAVERALSHGDARLVRVYSALVQLAARRHGEEAASALESLFYTLAQTHAFSLLCEYAMNRYYRQGECRVRVPPSRTADADEPHPAILEPDARITAREGDVLRRTALGHGNKEIASALNISVRTVEAHKANAMRKLGLAERSDVVRFALAHGWLHAR